MGKSLQSAARLHEISRVVSSSKFHRTNRLANRVANPSTAKHQQSQSQLKMESSEGERSRIPLAYVVADCAKRWFKDTLKEAKAGDTHMQLLVGQMYNSGYGVPRNPGMGQAWIKRASKSRDSIWKASEKQPGYRESDSDSDEVKNKAK